MSILALSTMARAMACVLREFRQIAHKRIRCGGATAAVTVGILVRPERLIYHLPMETYINPMRTKKLRIHLDSRIQLTRPALPYEVVAHFFALLLAC